METANNYARTSSRNSTGVISIRGSGVRRDLNSSPKQTDTSVTIFMLRQQIWNTKTSSQEALNWRKSIQRDIVQTERRVTFSGVRIFGGVLDGPDWPGDRWRENLVDALLRKNNQQSLPEDRNDLAKWIGFALAFSNDHIVGEGHEWSRGHRDPYDILNGFIEGAAARGWANQVMPEWAMEHLGSVSTGVRPDTINRYHRWPEIHNSLLSLLDAFHLRKQDDIKVPWDTDEAVQGALSLRLLATIRPAMVSERLVERLIWLDEHITSGYFKPADTAPLRSLIQVSRERRLLEQVTNQFDKRKLSSPKQTRIL